MSAEKPPQSVYRFDRFILDLTRGALLTSDGGEVFLRPKSFALLQLFVEYPGRLLDRDTIMSAVWPDVIVGDDSITQCVHDIRRAFGSEAHKLLRTVQRRGYLFTAAVARIVPAAPSMPASDDQGDAYTESGTKDSVDRPRLCDVPEQALGPLSQQFYLRSDYAQESEPLGAEPAQIESVEVYSLLAAERRQLTILSCDLGGLSEPSEQLDPEDLGSIIRVYREHWKAAIARFGGHVERYASDGVLAFFGYPQASEDAAECAVRAGLAIAETTHNLHPGLGRALQARVGIATGLVVNDQASQGEHTQITVGKPLNLAAWLLAIAKPGAVVIADSTRRLVGNLFALEDLGSHPVQGFMAPVRAWQATGEGVAESRFKALRGTNFMPLVGRNQELTLLLDRWEQAKEGEGQVVLLVGEPGIGKSRLVQALRDHLNDAPPFYIGCYCSPDRLDSPLQPIIALIERAAQFNRADTPARKLAKIEALLAPQNEGSAQLAPLVASILSLPNEERSSESDTGPRLQRERILGALLTQLAALSARRPVLLVCEDVHWADPTSLELLRHTIDRVQGLRVLTLITCRPEFVPAWPGHPHVTALTLNRLNRRRCDRLIAGLTGNKSLPQVVKDQIVSWAEGVPLFIEELVKHVLESGLLRDAGERYELAGPLPQAVIPVTLQDSLMARLDHLDTAKEIAQVGAVIGREFPHDLLTIFFHEKKLAEALRRLIEAGLVFCRGIALPVTYVFKHALVRDVAYASLLKSKRRQLHGRIAQALEDRFDHVVEVEPDVLAHHWTEAGIAEKAAVYRLKAGYRALEHSAMTEAIAQLTMGQALLQGVPEDQGRHRKELDLQLALGTALSAAKGMAALETLQAYGRARELCGKLGDEQHLIPVLLGLWSSHNARDELRDARAVAIQLLKIAEQKNNNAARLLGHRVLGTTLFELGEFIAAKTQLQRALVVVCPTAGPLSARIPYDPQVSGRAWLSLTLAVLGNPEQAMAQADQALAEAEQLQHHNTLALVLSLRCSLGQFLRDDHAVARHGKAALAIAVERDFAYWAGLATYFIGWAKAEAGETDVGIAEMRQGLAACQTTGARAYMPYNLALLADVCRRANKVLLARTLLDEALDQLRQTGARYCEAELLCIDGELRLSMSQPNRSGAEASFRRAIEVARNQHAKAVELRAASCLAQLWTDCGKRQQAYDLLAPIYSWFTEGFNTQQMIAARSILAGRR